MKITPYLARAEEIVYKEDNKSEHTNHGNIGKHTNKNISTCMDVRSSVKCFSGFNKVHSSVEEGSDKGVVSVVQIVNVNKDEEFSGIEHGIRLESVQHGCCFFRGNGNIVVETSELNDSKYIDKCYCCTFWME